MNDDEKQIIYNPIGYFYSQEKYKYEMPRQGVFVDKVGIIKLNPENNFEQALSDLDGFDKIWIFYQFHKNQDWKPKVLPPRSSDNKKKGVFATRAPYRPNNIGITCVNLEKIEGRKLYINNYDLLNETPIIDIKPYIPKYDSFPNAKCGWLDKEQGKEFIISFAETAKEKIDYIFHKTELDLANFAKIQLEYNPIDKDKKRITQVSENSFIIACRTWRILFDICENRINIKDVFSGYTIVQSQVIFKQKKDFINRHYVFINFVL